METYISHMAELDECNLCKKKNVMRLFPCLSNILYKRIQIMSLPGCQNLIYFYLFFISNGVHIYNFWSFWSLVEIIMNYSLQ